MHTYDHNDEHNCAQNVTTDMDTTTTTESTKADTETFYSKMWLEYNDFKDLSDNLYNAMERNRKYGTLMSGQLLRSLDFLNKVETMESIGTDFGIIEQQFLKRIEEHKVMFTTRHIKDCMFETPQHMTPNGIFNN